ncbi:MAG: hypothetical protein ACYTEQ_29480 [Planctomycetota bacterium]|jgi:hypothetical protein
MRLAAGLVFAAGVIPGAYLDMQIDNAQHNQVASEILLQMMEKRRAKQRNKDETQETSNVSRRHAVVK